MRPRPIKGVHTVSSRLADGSLRIYRYAWKGGPRLEGEPGTPEFVASYARAVSDSRRVPSHDKLSGLVVAYRSSPEFAEKAQSTKAERSRFLDLLQDEQSDLAIGGLPVETLADMRVRKHILAWRDQWAPTPRKADYAMQVLSVVLSWGVARGWVGANVLLGHAHLYSSNRADQIWTADEIERFRKAASSPEVGFIIPLACLTGLRRSALVRLRWCEVGDVAIVIAPGKKSERARVRNATIPLLDDTLALLKDIKDQQEVRWQELAALALRKGWEIPPKPETVLTNTRGRAWSAAGLEHQVIDTKQKVGIDRHLHDGRDTFATRLRLAGATTAEIADILGWEEQRVERLLSLYVDSDLVVRAFAERIRAKDAARRSGP